MGGSANERDGRLATVERLVQVLEVNLREQRFDAGQPAANQLVSATTKWIVEIRKDPTVAAELSAALQVFRNAAFAFRRLGKAGSGTDEGLANTCSTLIHQGKDLLEVHRRQLPPG